MPSMTTDQLKSMPSSSSDDDLPMVSLSTPSSSSSEDDQQIHLPKSRREDFLTCPLLETQARVGEEGNSRSCTSNSHDDGSESDMSYVSPGNQHPDADRNVYLQSLGSQAEDYGFEAPIYATRREDRVTRRDEPWISSFEPSVRYKAQANYVGNVCDQGHQLFARRYKQTRWCDLCTNELIPGSCGESCRACDFYDICSSCAETGGHQSHSPDASRPLNASQTTGVPPAHDVFQGPVESVPFWAPPASWHSAHLPDVHAPQSAVARIRHVHRMKLVRKQIVFSQVEVCPLSAVTVTVHNIEQ
jgi:hypothetical protein